MNLSLFKSRNQPTDRGSPNSDTSHVPCIPKTQTWHSKHCSTATSIAFPSFQSLQHNTCPVLFPRSILQSSRATATQVLDSSLLPVPLPDPRWSRVKLIQPFLNFGIDRRKLHFAKRRHRHSSKGNRQRATGQVLPSLQRGIISFFCCFQIDPTQQKVRASSQLWQAPDGCASP
jgi:hypothetical protein